MVLVKVYFLSSYQSTVKTQILMITVNPLISVPSMRMCSVQAFRIGRSVTFTRHFVGARISLVYYDIGLYNSSVQVHVYYNCIDNTDMIVQKYSKIYKACLKKLKH